MNENITPSKKITVGIVLSWLFGTLFLLAGIGNLATNAISGLIFIVLSIIILPPIVKLTSKKWNFHLSKGLKAIIIIVGLVVAGSFVDTSTNSSSPISDKKASKIVIEESKPNTKVSEVVNEKVHTPAKGTVSQRNALYKATAYLKTMPFSYDGLITQLEYDQFSNADAIYAAKNCGADWKNQAAKKAKTYLNTMAFSRSGLIKQLEYDKFSNTDAIYAAKNCGADWKDQAAKKAKTYLNTMAFSRGGLIKQLKYDGFTNTQAKYGTDAVGL